MALAMLIGLVAGYAWSVRSLHRQAHYTPPLVVTSGPAAARVPVLRPAAHRPGRDVERRTARLGMVREGQPGSAR